MDWSNPQKMDYGELVIKTLLELSRSDGILDKTEIMYIISVGNKIGLSSSEMEDVLRSNTEGGFATPDSEKDRMSFLYYMLFLMKIDGNINERERKLIHKVGFKLGFNELLLTDLINIIEDHLHEKVPPEALLSVVKKYLN